MLDNDALFNLTGFKQGVKQAAWLRRELGLEPAMGRDGHPRVSQFVVDQAQLARRAGAPAGGVASAPQPKWRKAA